MKQFISLIFFGFLIFSCAEKSNAKKSTHSTMPISNLSGKELANIHCAGCHSFVSPKLLPKTIWENDVLPAMGNRLGIFNGKHQPDSIFGSLRNGLLVKKANVFPDEPLLAREDWQKIVKFYVRNAPDTVSVKEQNTKIKKGLNHFKYREAAYRNGPPLTAMVKILPEKRGMVFSDSKRNKNMLTFLNPDLEKDYDLLFENTPIDYYEKGDTVFLTTIGRNVFPNDLANGAVEQLVFDETRVLIKPEMTLIANLQRPVSMAYGDLNDNGLEDIIACEYGDLTGKLVWYENLGKGAYRQNILRKKSGAIKAIIKDYNADGLNDIFVLMAQGDEGIFYFENTGNGSFKEKRLLSFSPLNGSQYMELADFNSDGHDDILYVCGDNADKTPILKDYHGIYIFFNDGNLNFKQAYFYQQNGAYKALPRDFDLDGDLDIAAISFFPDYLNSPEESFVYLENKGNLTFEASSFAESTKGRWIVMDAADIDDDGDIDLALGSFVQFLAKGDTTGLSKKWLTDSPSVILLENTIKE